MRDILELAGSLGFLDEVHDQFQAQPGAVDASWHAVLDEGGTNGQGGNGHGGNGHAVQPVNGTGTNGAMRAATGTTRAMPTFTRPGSVTLSPLTAAGSQVSVYPLVNAYRSRGHFAANLDPLGMLETARIVELEPTT